MKPLVSIIVPVYNVEAYIDDCVESLVNQTYDNVEILLIDDESKDGSLLKVQEWSNKFKHIESYSIPHGGLSSVRNFGIRKSKGEYLLFVDSDDIIKTFYVEALVESIEKNQTDIAFIGYEYVNVKKEPILIIDPTEVIKGNMREDFLPLWRKYGTTFLGSASFKIYRKSSLVINDMWFDESCPLAEDLPFNLVYLGLLESYSIVPKVGYTYFRREGVSLTTKLNQERLNNEVLGLQIKAKMLHKSLLKNKDILMIDMLAGTIKAVVNTSKASDLSKSEQRKFFDSFVDNIAKRIKPVYNGGTLKRTVLAIMLFSPLRSFMKYYYRI